MKVSRQRGNSMDQGVMLRGSTVWWEKWKKASVVQFKLQCHTNLNFAKFSSFFLTHFRVLRELGLSHFFFDWIRVQMMFFRFGTLSIFFIFTFFFLTLEINKQNTLYVTTARKKITFYITAFWFFTALELK